MEILFLNPTRRVEVISLFEPSLQRYGSKVNVACYEPFDPTMIMAENSVVVKLEWDADTLKHICRDWHIDLIIPYLDVDVGRLFPLTADLESSGTRVAMGSHPNTIVSLSKIATDKALREIGIPSPDQFRPESIKFPAVVKPDRGSGAVGVRKVTNDAEVLAAVKCTEEPMIQEWIEGTEYTVDAFCCSGEIMVAVPRKRLKVRGEVVIAQVTRHPRIVELCRTICEWFHFEGCVNIQFLEDHKGNLFCIDINPRISGGLPITIKAGVDIPAALLDYFLIGTVPQFDDSRIQWDLIGSRWLVTECFLHGDRYADTSLLNSYSPSSQKRAYDQHN
ncbi:ATP-grasp domain-containing protein [Sulfobacillus sp. hq2]|uniref:ATP-grasp domain-containing protein n=2 Tax=Sulfobacillus TaxID=28033 RepID=UPI00130481E9|nr:ATP-grasp domain-containing protein [Sulfobacillus sp. hq2]